MMRFSRAILRLGWILALVVAGPALIAEPQSMIKRSVTPPSSLPSVPRVQPIPREQAIPREAIPRGPVITQGQSITPGQSGQSQKPQHVHRFVEKKVRVWIPPEVKKVQVGVDANGKPIYQEVVVKPGRYDTVKIHVCSCGMRKG